MASQVKSWLRIELQREDFVATLASFSECASFVFDEFENFAKEWIEDCCTTFPKICFGDCSELKRCETDIVISLITRLAKSYFTVVTKFIIKALDSEKMKCDLRFVLKKYKEFLLSRHFWRYNFNKTVFSELCCKFNAGLKKKDDLATLVNMMNITALYLTDDDYNKLSYDLVHTLTMKTTTKDQILYFVEKTTLNKGIVYEIAGKWISLQDDDVLKSSKRLVGPLSNGMSELTSEVYYSHIIMTYSILTIDQPWKNFVII